MFYYKITNIRRLFEDSKGNKFDLSIEKKHSWITINSVGERIWYRILRRNLLFLFPDIFIFRCHPFSTQCVVWVLAGFGIPYLRGRDWLTCIHVISLSLYLWLSRPLAFSPSRTFVLSLSFCPALFHYLRSFFLYFLLCSSVTWPTS